MASTANGQWFEIERHIAKLPMMPCPFQSRLFVISIGNTKVICAVARQRQSNKYNMISYVPYLIRKALNSDVLTYIFYTLEQLTTQQLVLQRKKKFC